MTELSPAPNCWAYVMNKLALGSGETYVEPPILENPMPNFQVANNPSEANAIVFIELGGNVVVHAGIVGGSLENIDHVPPYGTEWPVNESLGNILNKYENFPDMAPLRYILLKKVEN